MSSLPIVSVIILSTIFLSFSLAGPRQISPNERFLTVERLEVGMNYYNQPNSPNWSPLNYLQTVPQRYQSSQLQSFLALQEFAVDYPDKKLNFFATLNVKNKTSIQILVFSDRAYYISKLIYRYLLISGEYASTKASNTNLLILEDILQYTNDTQSTGLLYEVITFPYSFNLSRTCSICGYYISYTGFKGVFNYSSTTYIYSNININNITSNSLLLVWFPHSSASIDYRYISIILWNQDFYNKAKFSSFYVKRGVSFYSNGATYTNVSNLYEKTTMTSFTYFKLRTDQTSLNLTVNFQSPDSLYTMTSSSSFPLGLDIFMIQTYHCRHSMPFYQPKSTLCYDICPPGTETNTLDLICCPQGCSKCDLEGNCLSCPYDCLTCNYLKQCLSCRIGEKRILKSGRCVPQDGYYESNSKEILPCLETCTLCTSKSSCVGCISGYTLQDGFCEKETFLGSSQFFFIVGGVFICQAFLLCYFCCWKKKEQKEERTEPRIDEELRSNQALFRNSNEHGLLIKRWGQLEFDFFMPTPCTGCTLATKPEIKIACSHRFHIYCLTNKAREAPKCPICEMSLEGTDVQITCRNCELKSAVLSYESMMMLRNSGAIRKTILCSDCKGSI